MSDITINHVYITRGVVSAWSVTTGRGGRAKLHRVGHLPFEGWFCCCTSGKRCGQIGKIKELVPVNAVELGARGVESGAIPAPGCLPTRQWVSDEQEAAADA